MNNNMLQSVDLQQYRLRSERHKIRMQYEDFDKMLLALRREEDKLYQQRKNLGWVELSPPVMRGYKRCYVLRDDVARSKDAAFYEGILQKINTVQYSSQKRFTVKKRKRGRKVHVIQEQHMLQPYIWAIDRLKLNEKELRCFELRDVINKSSGKPDKKYVFKEPWRFVLRVRPNIIAKTKVCDTAIERRMQEIHELIEQGGWKYRIGKLCNQSGLWKREVEKIDNNILKNKPLPLLLDEIKAW